MAISSVRAAPPAAFATRPARFEDVAAILRLIDRAVERGCSGHYDEAQRRAVCLSYARNLFMEALGPFEMIAAEMEGRLVGMAELDPAGGRLRALFVDAPFQGGGLGRALLADVEARASARGLGRIHGAMSLNAVPFYARAGFRRCIGSTRLGGALLVPVIPMEKALGPRTGR